MLRNETRFGGPLTLEEELALARARVRERRAGLRFCAPIAAVGVVVASVAALLSRADPSIARALPLLMVAAALACALLGIVVVSSLAWRLRLARFRDSAPDTLSSAERRAA